MDGIVEVGIVVVVLGFVALPTRSLRRSWGTCVEVVVEGFTAEGTTVEGNALGTVTGKWIGGRWLVSIVIGESSGIEPGSSSSSSCMSMIIFSSNFTLFVGVMDLVGGVIASSRGGGVTGGGMSWIRRDGAEVSFTDELGEM